MRVKQQYYDSKVTIIPEKVFKLLEISCFNESKILITKF